MRKILGGIAVFALVSLPVLADGVQPVNPGDTDRVPGTAACKLAAWTPEVLTFYGDHATVAAKLENVKANLLDRRMYLIAVESKDGSQVAVFEKKDKDVVTLSRWEGAGQGEVTARFAAMLLDNNGHSCAGELTKSFVKSQLTAKAQTEIAALSTVGAAFAAAAENADSSYVKVTIALLC